MTDVTPRTPPKAASKKPNSATAPDGKNDGKKHVDLNVRDPDAFQEGLIGGWTWVENNSHIVMGLLALLIVGGIGYSIQGWWSKRIEKKVQENFYQIQHQVTKIKEDFDLGKMSASLAKPDAKDAAKPQGKIASGDLEKDYGTLIADLEKLARENPSTAAGAEAAITAADTYLSYNRPDKAASVAQVAAVGLGDGHLLGNLSRMLWGSATAVKGDCKEALQIWKPLVDNTKLAYLTADASLRSGLCYESLGQIDEAHKMYEKVTASGGNTESATVSTAKGLLRALDLKKPQAAAAPSKG